MKTDAIRTALETWSVNLQTNASRQEVNAAFVQCDAIEAAAGTRTSLRDTFAAAALTGLMGTGTEDDMADRAKWAYQQADAMLAARDGQ